MKHSYAFLLFQLLCTVCHAQKHDYNWVLGLYGAHTDDVPETGGITIDFNAIPPIYHIEDERQMNIRLSNLTMSDKSGGLLFYSNGIYIADKNGNKMENGDSITWGALFEESLEDSSGYAGINDMMALPAPGQDSLYYILHLRYDTSSAVGLPYPWIQDLLYATIDMSGNNGLGKVIEKKVPILSNITLLSPIVANKHANGRDWWILTPNRYTQTMYRFLLDTEGIHGPWTQELPIIPVPIPQNENQYVFTPDGSKMAYGSKHTGIHTFDFDRCTGELSNLKYFPLEPLKNFV